MAPLHELARSVSCRPCPPAHRVREHLAAIEMDPNVVDHVASAEWTIMRVPVDDRRDHLGQTVLARARGAARDGVFPAIGREQEALFGGQRARTSAIEVVSRLPSKLTVSSGAMARWHSGHVGCFVIVSPPGGWKRYHR